MPRKAGHTHFTAGKRLRIKLRDGTTFFDHFVQREGRYVVLRQAGRVATRDVSVMSIAKGYASDSDES